MYCASSVPSATDVTWLPRIWVTSQTGEEDAVLITITQAFTHEVKGDAGALDQGKRGQRGGAGGAPGFGLDVVNCHRARRTDDNERSEGLAAVPAVTPSVRTRRAVAPTPPTRVIADESGTRLVWLLTLLSKTTVPPVRMVTPLADRLPLAPLKVRVPALTVVVPVAVWALVRVRLPAPDLASARLFSSSPAPPKRPV